MQTITCENHKQYSLSFYCSHCDTYLCRACLPSHLANKEHPQQDFLIDLKVLHSSNVEAFNKLKILYDEKLGGTKNIKERLKIMVSSVIEDIMTNDVNIKNEMDQKLQRFHKKHGLEIIDSQMELLKEKVDKLQTIESISEECQKIQEVVSKADIQLDIKYGMKIMIGKLIISLITQQDCEDYKEQRRYRCKSIEPKVKLKSQCTQATDYDITKSTIESQYLLEASNQSILEEGEIQKQQDLLQGVDVTKSLCNFSDLQNLLFTNIRSEDHQVNKSLKALGKQALSQGASVMIQQNSVLEIMKDLDRFYQQIQGFFLSQPLSIIIVDKNLNVIKYTGDYTPIIYRGTLVEPELQLQQIMDKEQLEIVLQEVELQSQLIQDQEQLEIVIEPTEHREQIIQTDEDTSIKQEPQVINEQTGVLDVCFRCHKDILFTDEYIKLLDCGHCYHRICLLHRLALVTEKKFFLTDKELEIKLTDEQFFICIQCQEKDQNKSFGRYRPYLVFDLLKEKSQDFQLKMIDREKQEKAKEQQELEKAKAKAIADQHQHPNIFHKELTQQPKMQHKSSIEEIKEEQMKVIHDEEDEEEEEDVNSVNAQQESDEEDIKAKRRSAQKQKSQPTSNSKKNEIPQRTTEEDEEEELNVTRLARKTLTEENKPQISNICMKCARKGINLQRYILAKTENQVFIKRKKNKVYYLEFPSCSCDFSDPLDLDELFIIFGKTFINKALWNLVEEECEDDFCEGCLTQKAILRAQYKCQYKHMVCFECFDCENCKGCETKKYNKGAQSIIEKQKSLVQPSKKATEDKVKPSKDKVANLAKKSKSMKEDSKVSKFEESKHKKSDHIDEEENDSCLCEITKEYVQQNFKDLEKLMTQKRKKDKPCVCVLCDLRIPEEKQQEIQNILIKAHSSHEPDVVKQKKQESKHEEPEESQLSFVQAKCVVCSQQKLAEKLTDHCGHYVCRNCIKQSILDPLAQEFNQRKQISSNMVKCPKLKCKFLIDKYMIEALTQEILPKTAQNTILEKLDNLYEPSTCCTDAVENEDETGEVQESANTCTSFVDQQRWLQICLSCQSQQCIVCQTDISECVCKRCKQCLSANLVKRGSTKSYMCPTCNKHYCETCHEHLTQCKCFQNSSGNNKGQQKATANPKQKQNKGSKKQEASPQSKHEEQSEQIDSKATNANAANANQVNANQQQPSRLYWILDKAFGSQGNRQT